ncbi:phosphate ABC transporter, permease [Deferribacter desulfuricans SSM1]|uniref:Phosphate transport system permease protein n=1 Tax=Deferribacter desulfuricans (strain DSM 14783 / JCM 11476 / NBRC 101012 / SSM1) TaxID=639282 RepID=D3PBC1_DEFDS|nr:phosphate ABC transporter permease subunit PstC [Deferribacter desulfuricans]BAI79894.1 phosphate ABC transporter, permease [Deferribacter desulfuricans SSM1]
MAKNRDKFIDNFFKWITFAGIVSVLLIVSGIFISLVFESKDAIAKFGVIKFLTTKTWDPVAEIFGSATMLTGTVVVTVLALIFAIPVAIGIAIFIVELCPQFLKGGFGTTIEMLASIPSIIYGMWGLFTIAPIMGNYIEPFLQKYLSPIPLLGKLFSGTPLGIDILSASLVLSIMLIPFIASITRDTLNLTPLVLKESAYGMGATKWEVIRDVMLPHSKFGIYGSIVIALGRALGETMAVAFVLGNNHKIPSSLFDAAATITVTLANEFTEADSDIYLSSLFYLALILFVSSFIILAFAKYMLRRASEK